jgi:hypothetical protein
MVKINSFLALSALGIGAIAHPTIKHVDRRLCTLEERSVFARADLTSRASILKATTWDPPSNMVTALDQVGRSSISPIEFVLMRLIRSGRRP